MIYDNGDWMIGASKIVVPLIQSKNNGKEFLVIDVIIPLSWHKCFGEIGARVEVPIVIRLHEHCSGCKERGIGYNGQGMRDIEY